MKLISKKFATQVEANNFYLKLCEQYDIVKWLHSPQFDEVGTYVWECA